MNKKKLQTLLKKLNSLEKNLPLDESKSYLESLLEEETKNFQTRLKDNPSIKFLDGFNAKLDKFKREFNLEPIISEIENIQSDINDFKDTTGQEFQGLSIEAKKKFTELSSLIINIKDDLANSTAQEIQGILEKVDKLQNEFTYQSQSSEQNGKSLKETLAIFEERLKEIIDNFANVNSENNKSNISFTDRLNDTDGRIQNTLQEIDKLRKEIFSRLSSFGGGNANRNIAIAGNSSTLSRYTDINFQNSSTISWTATNDDTNKWVNITASVISGGGSAGTSRTTSIITANTTGGTTANTDYVYITEAGLQFTLPTAVSNTNLYTVKNMAASSVLVATSAGQDIDGSATALLTTQYQSLSFISNGSIWGIV